MKNVPNYRQNLISILDHYEHDADLFGWIQAHPEEEQVLILGELKALFFEKYEATAQIGWLEKAILIEDGLNESEDAVQDGKLHSGHLEESLGGSNKVLGIISKLRRASISTVCNQSGSTDKIWNFIPQMVQMEKDGVI